MQCQATADEILGSTDHYITLTTVVSRVISIFFKG